MVRATIPEHDEARLSALFLYIVYIVYRSMYEYFCAAWKNLVLFFFPMSPLISVLPAPAVCGLDMALMQDRILG